MLPHCTCLCNIPKCAYKHWMETKIAIWPIKLQRKATICTRMYIVWDYKPKRIHRKPNMIEFETAELNMNPCMNFDFTLTHLFQFSPTLSTPTALWNTAKHTPLPTAAAIAVMKPRREKCVCVCVRETACSTVSISLFRCPIILKQYSLLAALLTERKHDVWRSNMARK